MIITENGDKSSLSGKNISGIISKTKNREKSYKSYFRVEIRVQLNICVNSCHNKYHLLCLLKPL